MAAPDLTVLDLPFGVQPDPDEYIRAAMSWHFSEETGSPFWLERARSLDFDPRSSVRCFADLQLFPDVSDELRCVPVRQLIPRGYGPHPDVAGVFESGGTTGAPKRVICPADWFDRMLAWSSACMDAYGIGHGLDWLGLVPSGPHFVGQLFAASAAERGGLGHRVDLDPRWVRQLIAQGRADEADAYAEHLIDQAALILRTQDIGVLTITPVLLERLVRREELTALVNEKVRAIRWGGTQLDADSRYLYQDLIFPGVTLYGHYGSTTVLGVGSQRPGDAEPCVFDSFSPYITYAVTDRRTGRPVAYGERGQVVMTHVSKSMLLPGSLERDMATRVTALPGAVGDAVADIAPVARFDGEDVIEGVY